MRVPQKIRQQYGLTKPFSKISQLPVGTHLQYFVRRDTDEIIRQTAEVVEYDSPSAQRGELVLIHHDNPLTNDCAIWDFDLTFDHNNRSRYYALDTRKRTK